MRCDQIEPRLDAFLDGELTAEEIAVLQSHLDGCPTCRRETESRRELRRAFAARPRVAAPSGLQDAILAAADSGKVGLRAGRPAGHRNRVRWGLALAAAASLAVVALLPRLLEREAGQDRAAPFTTPARVIVPRYGEKAGQKAQAKFGGIDLAGASQGRLK